MLVIVFGLEQPQWEWKNPQVGECGVLVVCPFIEGAAGVGVGYVYPLVDYTREISVVKCIDY